METNMIISSSFENFIFDWHYETYLLLGGYGSGKSHAVGQKIILKCLEEKRKVLVLREVYETHRESTYDLFYEILDEMDLLADDTTSLKKARQANKVYYLKHPMEFIFPNGSKIIFKGMDKPAKVKSLNGVSIVWLEEAAEIKYAGYKEMLGRIRTPGQSMHFILSFNPVGKENWTYRHFFVNLDNEGNEKTILSDETLYRRKLLVKNDVYYHHSVADDNPFLPVEYIRRLDDIASYDSSLYRVARHGRYGANGTRVLPQFCVADNAATFKEAINKIPFSEHYFGMDFGFEESYNAVLSVAVDKEENILYIYDEIYINHVTDDEMAELPKMLKLKDKLNTWYDTLQISKSIKADSEDPKAIRYYSKRGYRIKKCKKFPGSRLSYTRKIKRFKKIICSPKCINTIRELRELTYKKDEKGNVIYDQFNIDPHTLSAIWYALDDYEVDSLKNVKRNSKKGG